MATRLRIQTFLNAILCALKLIICQKATTKMTDARIRDRRRPGRGRPGLPSDECGKRNVEHNRDDSEGALADPRIGVAGEIEMTRNLIGQGVPCASEFHKEREKQQ